MSGTLNAGSGCPDQLPLPAMNTVAAPQGEGGAATVTSLGVEAEDPALTAGSVGLYTPPSAHPPLLFTVAGTPIPQGSHKGFVVNGRAVITQDNKKTRPWRTDVKHAALDALNGRPPQDGPVQVQVRFVMPRPKGHFRTGRNAHLLRDGAPSYPAGKPDTDKLVRAILDACTAAGVWRDDSQVVRLHAEKVYADHRFGQTPCAHVQVEVAS